MHVRYCRVQVKACIYKRESSHLEISIQIHCKGEEVKDLSSLTYVNLVLKCFVNCRNCCLVVRFFQIAALRLHSGPCECLRDTALLGNIFVIISCADSCQLWEEERRWEVCTIHDSWSSLESCCFQYKDSKEAIYEDGLVYSNLKICHCNSFLIILFRSCIWSRSGPRQGSFCGYCNFLTVKMHVLLWYKHKNVM